jgi:4'-phosphopantetheinyl transferase EntD
LRRVRRAFAKRPSTMTASFELFFQTAVSALSLPGVMIGHRLIAPGDETALTPDEAPAFASSVVTVRRASGAARIVARELLAQVGLPGRSVPKGGSGAPIWPSGVVGSMSHDSHVAVAAVGLRRHVGALGIDVEPAEVLPPELLDLVVTPSEKANIGEDPYRGRLLFVAKEAVYKAVYPLDRQFLDHHDVEVSISKRRAIVRNGRTVELRFCVAKHLLALAFLRSGDSWLCSEAADLRDRHGGLLRRALPRAPPGEPGS